MKAGSTSGREARWHHDTEEPPSADSALVASRCVLGPVCGHAAPKLQVRPQPRFTQRPWDLRALLPLLRLGRPAKGDSAPSARGTFLKIAPWQPTFGAHITARGVQCDRRKPPLSAEADTKARGPVIWDFELWKLPDCECLRNQNAA